MPFSNGVHDDFADQPWRRSYRDLIASGALPGGYATEDGVGLHYVGSALHEAVSVVAGKRAWRVEPDGQAAGARRQCRRGRSGRFRLLGDAGVWPRQRPGYGLSLSRAAKGA